MTRCWRLPQWPDTGGGRDQLRWLTVRHPRSPRTIGRPRTARAAEQCDATCARHFGFEIGFRWSKHSRPGGAADARRSTPQAGPRRGPWRRARGACRYRRRLGELHGLPAGHARGDDRDEDQYLEGGRRRHRRWPTREWCARQASRRGRLRCPRRDQRLVGKALMTFFVGPFAETSRKRRCELAAKHVRRGARRRQIIGPCPFSLLRRSFRPAPRPRLPCRDT